MLFQQKGHRYQINKKKKAFAQWSVSWCSATTITLRSCHDRRKMQAKTKINHNKTSTLLIILELFQLILFKSLKFLYLIHMPLRSDFIFTSFFHISHPGLPSFRHCLIMFFSRKPSFLASADDLRHLSPSFLAVRKRSEISPVS